MNIQRVNVTITMKMDLCELPEGITFERIAEMMARDKWSDGRYPFHTELLHEGLAQHLRLAVRDAVMEQMHLKYGSESVKTPGGTGTLSLAYLKADEAFKPVAVYPVDSIQAATIEPFVRQD